MKTEFNDWWDEDVLTEDNPFNGGTPAYWAWEGWCAGVKAEHEACAKAADDQWVRNPNVSGGDAIRARSNT